MAIQKSRRIPPLNPLRFTPINYAPPAGINTYPFDKGFFNQQIRQFFQDKATYYQQVAGTDDIGIYVDSICTGGINVSLIDNNGTEVHDFGGMYPEFVVPANIDPDFGLSYTTFTKVINLEAASIPDGRYHVLLEYLYGGSIGHADNIYDVSECIDYCEDGWDDTILFEYRHSINKYDVLFENSYGESVFPFYLRVEGVLMWPEPASHDTAFEDQGFVMRNLDSEPYNIYELIIGGNGAVPAWVIDKVNRILSCNNVKVEDMRVTKDNGANWTMVKAEGFPKMAASIKLRQYDTSRNHVHSNVAESDAERSYTESYSDSYT